MRIIPMSNHVTDNRLPTSRAKLLPEALIPYGEKLMQQLDCPLGHRRRQHYAAKHDAKVWRRPGFGLSFALLVHRYHTLVDMG